MNFIHPSCWNPRKIVIQKNNVSFHSSFWDPIKTDRRTNYFHFIPYHRVSRRTDVQTLHFIRHNRIKVRQTDRLRFILPLNLDPSKTDGQLFHPSYGDQTKTDRQTSFHPSFWNPHKTDGQTVSFYASLWRFRQTDGQTTFNFIPHIGIHVRQTDKLRYISSLILESTYDTRTNYVTFHPSYWNSRMTDGRTFHFTTHVGIVRQTDKLRFISPSTSDYVLFHSRVVVFDRQTDKLRFISLFFEFEVRQTNHFISPLILESQQDGTNLATFNPSYWNLRTTDGQTTLISSFILESKHDRRTNYVSFHPLFWDPRRTHGQATFDFTPHFDVLERQTDKLRFISPFLLESK